MSKQQIYNALRQGGLSQAGALAMMGNWQCESGLEPNRLQGDFSPYRTVSKDYVRRIENFTLQRDQFAHDAKGFGLAQWTFYSRKQALWDAWHKSGLSITSVELQVKFAISELQSGEYICKFDDDDAELAEYGLKVDLYKLLKKTEDLYSATKCICKFYEKPAVNNIDARFQAAKKLQYEIELDNKTEEPQEEEPKEEHVLKLTEIQIGSSGAVVVLLQAALNVRGYNCGTADGIFGAKTQSALNAFKRDNSLSTNGICNDETWDILLKR